MSGRDEVSDMAVDLGRYTVEDLLAMPKDGRRRELVRGELFEMPPTADRYGAVVMNLGILLAGPIKGQGLGIVLADSGVVLSRHPATVLGPDVAVKLGVSSEARAQSKTYGEQLPDIVFEVVSPSDSPNAVHAKMRTYLEAGVPMAVAVWPDREEITVAAVDGRWDVLTANETLDLSDLVPGLRIVVSEIFD